MTRALRPASHHYLHRNTRKTHFPIVCTYSDWNTKHPKIYWSTKEYLFPWEYSLTWYNSLCQRLLTNPKSSNIQHFQLTKNDITFKIFSKLWHNETIAEWHSVSLQWSRATQICFLISWLNLTSLHYYNACLPFSPYQCNSDTQLNFCVFILVTAFQQLWNLYIW